MRPAWMWACLLVAVSSWQSAFSWIILILPEHQRRIQRGTLLFRLKAAKAPPPPPKPPGSGFSFVEGGDYVDVRDEIEAMGGDQFFLEESDEEDEKESDPDVWQWNGFVDDDAHLDLEDDSHLDLE